MQTSMVFNQVHWPGVGDVDDCWVLSAIQAVNVSSPWLRLPGSKVFRKAAGNPDDPNRPDGGNINQIQRGIETVWPVLAGHTTKLKATTWSELVGHLQLSRPASISVDSSRLPPDLQFGFKGMHQITLVLKDGKYMYANPLSPVYSRWLSIQLSDVKDAILRYGRVKAGQRSVYAVILPNDAEALALWRPDNTPYSQEDMDEATKKLQDKIDAAREVLDG